MVAQEQHLDRRTTSGEQGARNERARTVAHDKDYGRKDYGYKDEGHMGHAGHAGNEEHASHAAAPQKKHSCRRTLCRLFKWTTACVLLLLLAVGGALYYFLFTLDGARTALTLAQKVLPSSIFVDTTIESGSFFKGLHLGKTLVEVQDVVAINADNLVLTYDLEQLKDKKLHVTALTSDNLSVALNDQLFAPKEEEPEPETPPFKLELPVEIAVDKVELTNFALASQLVDVSFSDFNTNLWAKGDTVGTDGIRFDDLLVHLKNTEDVAAQAATAQAATQAEEALAIKAGDQVVKVSNIDEAIATVVSAAQQGQSVAVVMMQEQHAQNAAQTEEELLQSLRPEVMELKEQYSNLNEYADALESALLNEHRVPKLVNVGPQIYEPAALLSDEEFERQLLAAAKPVKLKPVAASAASSAAAGAAGGSAAAGADGAGAGAVNAAAAGGAAGAAGVAGEGALTASTDVAGATGTTGAAGGTGASVKEFGSGNGAIAPLPTVSLPCNIVIKDLLLMNTRFYMDGFDTQATDIAFGGKWQGNKFDIEHLALEHEMGAAQLQGSVNLDQYYDLQVKLQAQGARNDLTHDLFEGALYGLVGDVEVSGDLTDLHLRSTLSLGGKTNLKARANVLSSAIPVRLSLQSQDFSYPIFAKEPLVNLKLIDLESAGNLEDGVDVNLHSLVSGFDFVDVATDLKAQVSYEKSHIDHLVVDGRYQKEKLAANVSGDFYYGDILGADAKIYAQVKDAGFVSPLLKGPLLIDGDFVALLNQNEQGKSAVSVATQPVYLENRIPRSHVLIEDFDPDTIETKLLAQVNTGKGQAKTKAAKGAGAGAARTVGTVGGSGAAVGSGASAKAAPSEAELAMAKMRKAQAAAFGDLVVDHRYDQALRAQTLNGTIRHEASTGAVQAARAGESLSAVRPLLKSKTLAGGVPDEPMEPTDLLISQAEYEKAVSLDPLTNEVAADGEPTILATIFNQDMPEVMADVRYIKGDLYFNGYKTTLNIQNVVGNLQHGFRVGILELIQANNTVLVEGQLTENGADLNALVDVQDFSTLVPSVEGSLAANLVTSGSMRDLNLELTGSAPRIRSGDVRLRKVAFNADVNAQTRAFNITLLADRVRLAKGVAPNNNCFIDLSGTLLRHSLSANCGGQTSAFINLDGSLDLARSDYTANLMELYLGTRNAGSLSLSYPVNVNFNFNNQSGELSPIELRGEVGLLTVAQTKFSPKYTKSHVNLTDFNVESLKEFLPENLQLSLPLNMDADILVKDGNPDVNVAVTSDQGAVYTTDGVGVAYDQLDLRSHFTKTLLRTTLALNLTDDQGKVSSQIDISDPMGAGKLGGFFRIKDFDLATISNVGQSFTELKGATNVDVTFGGNLQQPLVFGSLKTQGNAVPRYDVGQINEFLLTLNLQGTKGVLDGKVVLNEEPVNLSGNLDWSQGANGSLHAQAKELPIFLVGYGVAQANIDADVRLGEVLDITGKVEIPSANIQVNNVASSGVSVSGDEIIVPKNGTMVLMKEEPSSFKNTMDLKVHLGDDVDFSAMGMVKGRLVGDLAIKKAVNDDALKAKGEINVAEGNADIYGHRFNFSTARVIFFDDIADPNLNIEVLADRDYLEDDVDVGVRVTGTASAPHIGFFSRPTMSENEILSYILYGHGLDKNVLNQGSNASGSMASSLLLGLGVSGVSGMVSSLASSFGMSEVQFNTQGSGDDTQVEVQGYINRRLRLSYGYGLFSSIGEFKVRYELIRNLYAEFVSSLDQAVDLIYSFEFD